MIITRKIQVFVTENDEAQRKAYYDKLYENRYYAWQVANLCASSEFSLDHLMAVLDKPSREVITFIGAKDNKVSRQNAVYALASRLFKGKADMGMVSAVIQNVQKMYKDDRKNGGMFDRSLRSYKASLPVPYATKRFVNLRFAEYVNGEGEKRTGCFFSLVGVPFQMRFGYDRSGNRLIVERIINQMKYDATDGKEGEATGYRMCTSSLAFEKKFDPKKDKKVTKIFLYLCVDIPKKEVELDPDKVLYARLGIANPIICACDVRAAKEFDSGIKWFEIGTAEEFLYRRRQIQEALRRCQTNCRYNKGGKGRKKKMQAIKRFEDAEINYVDTKLHTYAKQLVDIAICHKCGQIVLVDQERREKLAKEADERGEHTILRNWSYYSLKDKIHYKADKYNIKVQDPPKKKKKGNSEDDDEDDA